MRTIAKTSALFAGLLAAAAFATQANAQATRTWVSGVGDDANPCSRTAPCKTFAGAISKTATAGEINVLDLGGFGGVTINKSITIRSNGFEAGVLVSGTNAIVVNLPAATDRVMLEGLDVEGLGTGINGVNIVGNGRVYIANCKINHFTSSGVNLAGVAGAAVVIADSTITNNPTGVTIGTNNSGEIVRSILDANTNNATLATAAGAGLSVANSVLTGSTTFASGNVVSFGPSNVVTGGGAFNGSPIPFK